MLVSLECTALANYKYRLILEIYLEFDVMEGVIRGVRVAFFVRRVPSGAGTG